MEKLNYFQTKREKEMENYGVEKRLENLSEKTRRKNTSQQGWFD